MLQLISAYLLTLRWASFRTPPPPQPVKPPYLIPGISHLAAVLFNTESFLRSLQRQFQGKIITLSSILPILLDSLQIFFGLPGEDAAVFDHMGISHFEQTKNHATHHTHHSDPSRRVMEHQRKDFAKYLSGEDLKQTMHQYASVFRQSVLPTDVERRESTCIPDVYNFLRDIIFRAEVEALYGNQIFTACPSLCADFWAFYDAFPVISRQSPQLLFRSHYATRDKMIRNFIDWRGAQGSPASSCTGTPEDTSYGTPYVRDMVRRHEALGFSETGVASVMLGYLFVGTANTVPAAIWMVMYILRDASLAGRIRSELRILPGKQPQLDLALLMKAPLLNSVYREVLRLHVAGTVGRKSPLHEVQLRDGRVLLPEVPVMSSSWLGGLDESFWNTGAMVEGVPEHPVDAFWAERFLAYADDPMSGPIRRHAHEHAKEKTAPKTADDGAKARLVSAGIQNHWFPFGGGAGKCPGELLAKSTMLVTAFLVLSELEVEIVDHEQMAFTVLKHRDLPFGSHALGREIAVRVRRRLSAPVEPVAAAA
ncbi:25-hydroxycholesterol 7-alpha-hydroxylase [Colletotrichum fructicola Nara gc5]|uniref:25-hydroxycholesterol 7-alpha-hydroxylase n=1 Tax=Colletotrichum fructicola (strain Nara gc5) TaxID=1213859 RepID=A0A7J6IBZ2_COLFN|nr:25-hydroxycholesterol 7-alpha-hydroxylase [Colletotrichum fructicola Nara gc5]